MLKMYEMESMQKRSRVYLAILKKQFWGENFGFF